MGKCKICSNVTLKEFVNKLRETGYSYRQIRERFDTIGIKVSLGLLSSHFWHDSLEKVNLKLPTLRSNEVFLTPDQSDDIWVHITHGIEDIPIDILLDANKTYDSLVEKRDNIMETNFSLLQDLREIFHSYPFWLERVERLFRESCSTQKIPIPD